MGALNEFACIDFITRDVLKGRDSVTPAEGTSARITSVLCDVSTYRGDYLRNYLKNLDLL